MVRLDIIHICMNISLAVFLRFSTNNINFGQSSSVPSVHIGQSGKQLSHSKMY